MSPLAKSTCIGANVLVKNELIVGEPRLGWFVDGNPDTEQIAVMLRDTGAAIELTVPLQGIFADSDPYGRWWSRGVVFADDLDRSKYSYGPPGVLLMHDHTGGVALVGCRATGANQSFRVGQGRIVANFAVIGGQSLKYEKVHGLRTGVPALAAWTNLSTMKVNVTTDESNRFKSVGMTLTNAPEVHLTNSLNLRMKSTWRTETPRGQFLAYESVKLETRAKSARTWDEHLRLHGAVLDLVSISAWQAFGFDRVEVMRADDSDPATEIGESRVQEKWSDVATHRVRKHKPWSVEPRFLLPYSEVGPRGIDRWLKLRQDYQRAIQPLVSILRSDDHWSDPNIVLAGIALEALGYLIDVKKNSGLHLDQRKQMKFKTGLQVILDDLPEKPFADTRGWMDRATDTYMGAKHPDRPELDIIVALNTMRETLLVIRFWIAQQLGVDAGSLRDGLHWDPLAHEFVLAE